VKEVFISDSVKEKCVGSNLIKVSTESFKITSRL